MPFDPSPDDRSDDTALTTSPDGAGKRGRAARTKMAGSGRPAGYTDDDCQKWWLRLIGGESTLDIAKGDKVDQNTVIAAIQYIAAVLDEGEDTKLERTKLIDYNRALRQSLQKRLDESTAILSRLDAMLAKLAPSNDDVLNMSLEDIKKYQSILASRQYEVQSQIRVTAEIRAAQVQYAELTGVKNRAKTPSKGKGGDDDSKPRLSGLVGKLSALPENELDSFGEDRNDGF